MPNVNNVGQEGSMGQPGGATASQEMAPQQKRTNSTTVRAFQAKVHTHKQEDNSRKNPLAKAASPSADKKYPQPFSHMAGQAIKDTMAEQATMAEEAVQANALPQWSQARMQASVEETAPAQTSNSASSVQAIQKLQDMVDHALMSTNSLAHGGELRLTIKDSLLPNTELRLQEKAGLVTINFVTHSPTVPGILTPATLMQLQQSLEKNHGKKFNVKCTAEENTAALVFAPPKKSQG